MICSKNTFKHRLSLVITNYSFSKLIEIKLNDLFKKNTFYHISHHLKKYFTFFTKWPPAAQNSLTTIFL